MHIAHSISPRGGILADFHTEGNIPSLTPCPPCPEQSSAEHCHDAQNNDSKGNDRNDCHNRYAIHNVSPHRAVFCTEEEPEKT